MGRSRNALWVRPSIRLRGLRQKVEKRSTFQAAPDPAANQITVMQIHFTRFRDPFCNNKLEEAGKIWPLYIFLKKCGIIGLFVYSFVLIFTHRLCRGRRFNWLQYASTKTSPLYVRHALGHPPTDSCSVNKALELKMNALGIQMIQLGRVVRISLCLRTNNLSYSVLAIYSIGLFM
ncbi:unnamed protein product [Gadus morhua 'NCC']